MTFPALVRRRSLREAIVLVAALTVAAPLAGCGKSGRRAAGHPPGGRLAPPETTLAGPGSAGASADSGTAAGPAAAPADPFTGPTGIVDVTRTGIAPALLIDVRSGEELEVDRMEFTFGEGMPGYHVEYADSAARSCASGLPVPLAGSARLEITFRAAAAHDEAGGSSVPTRELSPGYDNLKQFVLNCDIEGEVVCSVGIARRTPFRVRELDDPPRLVVEVKR